jgi:hypothetical protein
MRVEHTTSKPGLQAGCESCIRPWGQLQEVLWWMEICGVALGTTVDPDRGGTPKIGAGGGNRTHGLGIMRPSLYH